MKDRLKNYGFPNFIIDKLLKEGKASVNYGMVKLDRKTGKLTTVYHDGRTKTIELN